MNERLPVIDLDLGAKLLGSDEPVARKMIKELAALLPESLQDLKTAYFSKDIQKLGDIAHYVHGGSCYCGTPRLKAAAMTLEKGAKDSQPIKDLAIAYQDLCREIEAVITESREL